MLITELERRRSGWCWDVGQAFKESFEGGLPVVDGGEHALQVVLGLQPERFGGVLGGVEVALGAGRTVRGNCSTKV